MTAEAEKFRTLEELRSELNGQDFFVPGLEEGKKISDELDLWARRMQRPTPPGRNPFQIYFLGANEDETRLAADYLSLKIGLPSDKVSFSGDVWAQKPLERYNAFNWVDATLRPQLTPGNPESRLMVVQGFENYFRSALGNILSQHFRGQTEDILSDASEEKGRIIDRQYDPHGAHITAQIFSMADDFHGSREAREAFLASGSSIAVLVQCAPVNLLVDHCAFRDIMNNGFNIGTLFGPSFHLPEDIRAQRKED